MLTTTTTAPSTGRAHRSRPMSPRAIVALTLPGTAFGVWLFNATYRVDLEISEMWTIVSASIIALSATNPHRRRRHAFWLVAAALVLITAGVSVMSGAAVEPALWYGVVNLVAAVVGLVVYRLGLDHPGWEPRTPTSIVSLLAAASCASVVVVLLAGHPGPDVVDLQGSIWWYVRVFTGTWIGLVTFLVVAYWRRPPIGRRVHPAHLALICVLGVASLGVAYARPDIPISWLCLVPGLWAGLVLGPRAAAAYCLFTAIVSGLVVGLDDDIFDYAGLLPPAILIDLMMCFATFLTMLLALFRDQRLRMLQELDRRRIAARHQADLLRTMIDSMSDGFVFADTVGNVQFHNTAATRLLGREFPGAQPESWARYFDLRDVETDAPLTDDDLPLVTRGHAERSRREMALTDGGGRRILSAESRLLGTGADQKSVLLFHDTTAEYTRQEQLRGFVGTVAHDLKGPLAATTGWLEAADDELVEDDAPAGRMALVRARDAGARMGALIDDYLSYAVTREGTLVIEEVSLAQIAADVTAVHDSARPDAPHIVLDVPHTVRADRGLMTQLLANLVGNAVKYRRPDEPAHITVRSTDAGPGRVRLDVVDRGLGLAPGDEDRIFAAFNRSDKDADQVQGIGLGLALCHSIVVRHGGTIQAVRNPHGGATFSVVLPA